MKIFLKLLLVFSLCLNFFLGWQVFVWIDAWGEQLITTSEIEKIYKLTGSELTYETALEIAKNKYEGSYQLIEKDDDTRVIIISGTQLIFQNNEYLGSRADLPKTFLW